MSNNLLLHVQNQVDSCNDPTKYYNYTGGVCQKCPQIDHMHSEAVIYCTHSNGQHADDRKFANETDTNLCQICYSAKFGTGNKKKKDIKYNRLESVTNVSSPSTSKLNF